MRFVTVTALWPSFILAASGAVLQVSNRSNNNTTSEVNHPSCVKVYKVLDYNSQLSSPNDTKPIPVQDAYHCLKAMPYDEERGKQHVKELTKYIQFQSTLEALKKPPKDYGGATVDILSGLSKIAETKWGSQYDFDVALTELVNLANDGHFALFGCSLAILNFQRGQVGLVSISKDGLALPQIYLSSDNKHLIAGNSSVSPVATINGEPVDKYLGAISRSIRAQDADTRYNRLFFKPSGFATDSGDAFGQFAVRDGLWPGSNATVIQFENGTTIERPTVAVIKGKSFDASPDKLYQQYCLPLPPNTSNSSSPAGSTEEPAVPPPLEKGPELYPEAILRDDYNQILGYHLDNETTVMFLPTFELPTGVPQNHSATVSKLSQQIVAEAQASGRTKIIIDVSGNGGGDILRGFDMFKLFFPSEQVHSETRMRRHDGLDVMAKIFGTLNVSASDEFAGPFGYKTQVTPDQKHSFSSLEEFLGSEKKTQLGVRVTAPYANFNFTTKSEEDDPIRGYGAAVGLLNKTQPFRAEDILIVGDGVCASTCTTFVNLMTNVGGVRTVVFGGRPATGPMQIMGGVRGGQSMQYSNIAGYLLSAAKAVELTPGALTPSEAKRANSTLPKQLAQFPLQVGNGGVNLRSAYQQGNPQLPLQFDYQAADCRLFYTAKNIQDPASAWKDAKRAAWGGGKCISGSTGAKGSLDFKKQHANDDDSGDDESSGGGDDRDKKSLGGKAGVSGIFMVVSLIAMLALQM